MLHRPKDSFILDKKGERIYLTDSQCTSGGYVLPVVEANMDWEPSIFSAAGEMLSLN